MENLSMRRPHSAHATVSGMIPVAGKIRLVQWCGACLCTRSRCSFSAGVNPTSDDLIFQSLNSLKLFNMCSPFALDMSAEPRLITAHPRSLEPKLSIDMIPCIIGSLFKGSVGERVLLCSLRSCPLDCHMLSRRIQKNQMTFQSRMWLSFSAWMMVVMFFTTFSLGLLLPTYNISNWMPASTATFLAAFVKFRIHSMSSPPYKQMYFLSVIWNSCKNHIFKNQDCTFLGAAS